MKQLRIYVDTSVIGGCFDDEFAEWSNALMANFRADLYRLVISDVTAAEIAMAPESIREMFTDLLSDAEFLQISSEAVELASAYESHGILGHGFRNDMLHIAIAAVGEVDVVVSWNFKHIVRLDKIRLFNAVNQ